MGCRKKKFGDNCIKTPSRCVFYDLELPKFSKLNLLNDCLSVEDTTSDLYSISDFIVESLDLSKLKDFTKCGCIEFKESKSSYNDKDVYLVKDVIETLTKKVCELDKSVNGGGKGEESALSTAIFNEVFNGLDFKCLKPCKTKVTSLTTLFQLLIDEICKINNYGKDDNSVWSIQPTDY